MTLRASIVSQLMTDGWPILSGEDETAIVTAHEGEHGAVPVVIAARAALEQVVFYALSQQATPSDRLGEVVVLITRANWSLAVGNFEVDLDDGEVRFRTSVDVQGAQDRLAPLITHHLGAAVQTFDRFRPALVAVQTGEATAEEALAMVFRSPSPGVPR